MLNFSLTNKSIKFLLINQTVDHKCSVPFLFWDTIKLCSKYSTCIFKCNQIHVSQFIERYILYMCIVSILPNKMNKKILITEYHLAVLSIISTRFLYFSICKNITQLFSLLHVIFLFTY